MVIKAVILDFGGTLAEGSMDWSGYHRAIIELLAGLGFDISAGRLRVAVAESMGWLEGVRRNNVEPTFEELYSRILAKVEVPVDDDILRDIRALYRNNFKVTIYPCVPEVVKELSRSYKLAIMSNTLTDTPRFVLESSGLIGHFKAVVCSSDLGIRKPDPRTFQYILERLKVMPKEAVHVGDGVETDM